MFCSKCGQQADSNNSFCRGCGARLTSISVQPSYDALQSAAQGKNVNAGNLPKSPFVMSIIGAVLMLFIAGAISSWMSEFSDGGLLGDIIFGEINEAFSTMCTISLAASVMGFAASYTYIKHKRTASYILLILSSALSAFMAYVLDACEKEAAVDYGDLIFNAEAFGTASAMALLAIILFVISFVLIIRQKG